MDCRIWTRTRSNGPCHYSHQPERCTCTTGAETVPASCTSPALPLAGHRDAGAPSTIENFKNSRCVGPLAYARCNLDPFPHTVISRTISLAKLGQHIGVDEHARLYLHVEPNRSPTARLTPNDATPGRTAASPHIPFSVSTSGRRPASASHGGGTFVKGRRCGGSFCPTCRPLTPSRLIHAQAEHPFQCQACLRRRPKQNKSQS